MRSTGISDRQKARQRDDPAMSNKRCSNSLASEPLSANAKENAESLQVKLEAHRCEYCLRESEVKQDLAFDPCQRRARSTCDPQDHTRDLVNAVDLGSVAMTSMQVG